MNESDTLLPVQFNNPYDGGVWMYTDATLTPDYNTAWFMYEKFCTSDSISACGFPNSNSNNPIRIE